MSSPPRRLPPKKDVILELLTKSGVFLHLDPRREGVVVPQQFRKQAELVLQVGLNMAVPVRDLEVDEEGVTCTLSFNRSPFWCRMPWPSVFAIVSDEDRRGVVWPDDVPAESKLAAGPPPPPKRPRLRAVGPADEAGDTPEQASLPPEQSPVQEGEGTCGECSTRWVEGQDACPICGASRADAWRSAGEALPQALPEAPPSPPLAIAPRGRPQAVPDLPATPPTDAATPAAPAPALADGAAPDGAAPDRDSATETPAEAPAASDKPKRQLPPYLRIVK